MVQPLLRDILPPIARRWGNRLLGNLITLRGPYSDWEAARAASRGYDSEAILARVTAATQRVLSGSAAYEQDGVAMTDAPAPCHALAALLLGAARGHGRLSVADLGGGLGSHYLRWRAWLAPLPELHWCVVEQPAFVAAGRRLFAQDAAIAFAETLEQARPRAPNVAIASSVLQYLPDPHAMLAQLLSLGADIVIVDRTPYDRHGQTGIVTQHVPRRIGAASYPQWIFARESIYAALRQYYDLLMDFPTADGTLRCGSLVADYRGSAWLRRRSA